MTGSFAPFLQNTVAFKHSICNLMSGMSDPFGIATQIHEGKVNYLI